VLLKSDAASGGGAVKFGDDGRGVMSRQASKLRPINCHLNNYHTTLNQKRGANRPLKIRLKSSSAIPPSLFNRYRSRGGYF
jgi:hypothetical protein